MKFHKLSFDDQYDVLSKEHSFVSYDTKHFEFCNIMKLGGVLSDKGFKSKWSKKKKSAFVKSVLLGCPLQNIVCLFRDKIEDSIILDGKNRVFALFEFYNNDLKLNDDTILLEFNGLYYNDLSSYVKRTFIKNCEMRVIALSAKTVPLVKKLGLVKG